MSAATLLQEVVKASYKQSDLRVIQQGMPAYLLLMDGMVEAWPENAQLLVNAAQGYASFASAFIEDEDKDYARILYLKATTYALRALAQRGLKNLRSKPFDAFEADLEKMHIKDVPYLFWAASCWGNWIGANMGSMEALAELPRVEAIMKRVLELDEKFYYGGAHLFMGIWYASQPKAAGGDLDRSYRHFKKALELAQGRFLMAHIYYARYYARKAFDKDLYMEILNTVLKTPADIIPELTLLNTLAHQKAQSMQAEADDFF